MYVFLFYFFTSVFPIGIMKFLIIDFINIIFFIMFAIKEKGNLKIPLRLLFIIIIIMELLLIINIFNKASLQNYGFLYIFTIRIFLFGFILYNGLDKFEMDKVCRWILYSSLLLTIISIIMFYNGKKFCINGIDFIYELGENGYRRFSGFAGDSNFYISSLILPIFYIWNNIMQKHEIFEKIKYLILLLFFYYTMLLTLSRIALVVIFLTIFLFLYDFLKIRTKTDIRIALYAIFVALIGIFILYEIVLLNNNLYDQFRGRIEHYLSKPIDMDPRVQMWIVLSEFFKNNLWGYGFKSSLKLVGAYAHNSYLEVLIDMGIIGGGLLVGCVIYTLNKFKNNRVLFYSCIVLYMFMVFFSIQYSPFYWFYVILALFESTDVKRFAIL